MTQTTLSQKREEYRRRLEQAVSLVRERLGALPGVQRVSLFGSYARGRADLMTDLDVLVVMETTLPIPERLARLYSLLALPVDADLLCYTPDEFERLRSLPFLRHALADEVVIVEKDPT